jgi:hypothetical protein
VFAIEEHVIVTADEPEMLSSIPRDTLLEVK